MIDVSAASGVARPACLAEVAKLAASDDDERGRCGTGTLAVSCLVRGGMKLLVPLVRVRARSSARAECAAEHSSGPV